jgi:hypothetical protein
MTHSNSAITRWLTQAPAGVMNSYAMAAAFTTYFCMYAFRKPFSAATHQGYFVGGTEIELKTAFVISQIIGYALSKVAGIKFCSEVSREFRCWMLILLVGVAEVALVLFAVLPPNWKIVAIFLNGLPLGMVWGLVVRYLEGRRTSEILLAALACSFIVSSGVVKDVGRALLAGDHFRILGFVLPNPFSPVAEFWMPAATGLIFAPLFLLAVWMLNQIPEPNLADVTARTQRDSMDAGRRREFLMRYLLGIALLIGAYFFLTAFRDFRDNYMVELLGQLGYRYEENRDIMSQMEAGVAVGVMVAMSLLCLVKDNRRGLLGVFCVIVSGLITMGAATALHRIDWIGGFTWLTMIGLGSYLAYVPYNTVLFDRLMASTRFVGTAVFAMYVADSVGYTGSIAVQLGKDLAVGSTSRLEFLLQYALFVSIFGTCALVAAGVYFLKRSGMGKAEAGLQIAIAEPSVEYPA